jgi:Leucine-rich repeat (LRR) protein
MKLYSTFILLTISLSHLVAQVDTSDFDEISAKYSLKTLPNEFVGVVDQQGYLINKPESVLAFSLEGDYSRESYRDISKFLGIERGSGIWFDELYRCKQLLFFEYSLTALINPDFDFSRFSELREVYVGLIGKDQLGRLLAANSKIRCLSASNWITYPKEFCDLKSLEYLVADGLNFVDLTEECLQNLSTLKYLRVDNPDSNVVKKIFSIPSLEVLEIVGTNTLKIPESIREMKHLKQLTMANFDTVIIHKELYRLDSLELLYIEYEDNEETRRGQGVVSFPPVENGLQNLKAISLQGVLVKELPQFGAQNSLVYMDYYLQGQFNETPFDFTNLVHLKRCHIESGGMFRDFCNMPFPIGIEHLAELEELRLPIDSKEQLPKGLLELKKLRMLQLYRQRSIKDIKFLGKLQSLEFLQFEYYPREIALTKYEKALKSAKLKEFTEGMSQMETDIFTYYLSLIRDREQLVKVY